MATEKAFVGNNSNLENPETPFYEPKVSFPKTFISKWVSKSGAGAIPSFYTVPAGKILIMITAKINQSANNSTGGGEANIETNDPNMSYLLKTETISPPAGQTDNAECTLNFNEGIRFPAGTVITAFRGSNQSICAGFVGYLVDSNAESLFYLD